MCSFLVANWLIANLTYANFFLQPRGPDHTTRWSGYGFEFVHNLLHMTGERVVQPFHDPRSRVVALFNGEVYNWRELQGPGDHFRSDGEVLIQQYLRRGVRFAQSLDGEFAAVVFDFALGRAVFATDLFGTKPLWFARAGGGRLAVASYRSALERLGVSREVARILEPNSALVLQIPRAEQGEQPAAAAASSAGPPPRALQRLATFEFDLRQHKTHTRDWQAAFLAAVRKRVQGSSRQVAMCLSDGYDSGAISLALGRLGVPHSLYTIQAREDVSILAARLEHLRRLGVGAGLILAKLSANDLASERAFLGGRAERTVYRMRGGGYANVDDKAAAGLSWIYRTAAEENQRLFLSGSGADETISDYGMGGRALEFHSTLRGAFPEDLSGDFPWLNFFMGTQRDYLAKEEGTAGAHGVEARYPFLDRALVQEYIWLDASLKNSAYKAPLRAFLEEARYPFVPDTKRGFSADRNLVGGEEEAERQQHRRGSQGAAAVEAAEAPRERLWTAATEAAAATRGCHAGGSLAVHVGTHSGAAAAAGPARAARACRVSLEMPRLLALAGAGGGRSPAAAEGRGLACGAGPCGPVGVAGRQAVAGRRLREPARRGRSRRGASRRCSARRPWALGCGARRLTAGAKRGSAVAQTWAARLAGLRPLAGAKVAKMQGELAPALSLAAANGRVPRHRVVFMTSCMEEEYFWTYCTPLFSSLAEAFEEHSSGAAARSVEIDMQALVATAGVAAPSLEQAEAAFAFVRFASYEEDDGELSRHADPREAENHRRTAYQSLKLDQYLRLWQEHIFGRKVDFVVCMDSDMLVARPFGHVFEHLAQRRVDVAFTYYDGRREVPWGTAEELATTRRHGYVRLQGGLLLMRNSIEALRWFAWWVSLTRTMLHDVQNGGPQQERWSALHKEFKGPSQAALAFLLAQGEFEAMESVQRCCSSVRTVHLEAPRPGGEEVEVRMLGLPARYMNDAESTEDGSLPSSVLMVHLKGHWWRSVLPHGDEDLVVPTRSYEWNREAFELWRRHSRVFRPPPGVA